MFELDFEFAEALKYGIPFFSILTFVEFIIKYFTNKISDVSLYIEEVIASISSGLSFVLKIVLGFEIIFFTYPFMLENYSIFKLDGTLWWQVILLFLIIDFMGYWKHRWHHTINILWNSHRVHHTGEVFNLPTALRQPVSEFVSYAFIFSLPVALLGFPVKVFALVSFVHLVAQFWYHTEVFGRLGFLERIISTPTNHKIHHAMNNEYLDKNFAPIFIFWDILFGTYQDTIQNVEPIIGDTRPSRTYNLFILNFHHFYRLLTDAIRTKKYLDKFRIWFMPTGWRPADVIKDYPILAVKNPKLYKQEFIFSNSNSKSLRIWNLIKFITIMVAIYLFFINIKEFHNYPSLIPGLSNVILIGIFLFMFINTLTLFMDRNKWSWIFEMPQFVLGMTLIIYFYSKLPFILFAYIFVFLLVSFATTIYYSIIFSNENIEDKFYTNDQITYKV